MHFGAHLERAPTVRNQASPGQARHERRPGSCVHQGPSPERGTHVGTPQGLVRDGRFSQGVALGWLVAGPLALKASSFVKYMTDSRCRHSGQSYILILAGSGNRPSNA